jgi:hypothetical protein
MNHLLLCYFPFLYFFTSAIGNSKNNFFDWVGSWGIHTSIITKQEAMVQKPTLNNSNHRNDITRQPSFIHVCIAM